MRYITDNAVPCYRCGIIWKFNAIPEGFCYYAKRVRMKRPVSCTYGCVTVKFLAYTANGESLGLDYKGRFKLVHTAH